MPESLDKSTNRCESGYELTLGGCLLYASRILRLTVNRTVSVARQLLRLWADFAETPIYRGASICCVFAALPRRCMR